MIQRLEHSVKDKRSQIDAICILFEAGESRYDIVIRPSHDPIAANQAKRTRRDLGSSVFSVQELEWFSRTGYNLALKSCAGWHPSQTLRLTRTCLQVCSLP